MTRRSRADVAALLRELVFRVFEQLLGQRRSGIESRRRTCDGSVWALRLVTDFQRVRCTAHATGRGTQPLLPSTSRENWSARKERCSSTSIAPSTSQQPLAWTINAGTGAYVGLVGTGEDVEHIGNSTATARMSRYRSTKTSREVVAGAWDADESVCGSVSLSRLFGGCCALVASRQTYDQTSAASSVTPADRLNPYLRNQRPAFHSATHHDSALADLDQKAAGTSLRFLWFVMRGGGCQAQSRSEPRPACCFRRVGKACRTTCLRGRLAPSRGGRGSL